MRPTGHFLGSAGIFQNNRLVAKDQEAQKNKHVRSRSAELVAACTCKNGNNVKWLNTHLEQKNYINYYTWVLKNS